MDFEWDERKRRSNIDKHKLDFQDADIVFANPHLVGAARTMKEEQRSLATGMLDDICVTVIFTFRGDVLRIISMQRARLNEQRQYKKIFGG